VVRSQPRMTPRIHRGRIRGMGSASYHAAYMPWVYTRHGISLVSFRVYTVGAYAAWYQPCITPRIHSGRIHGMVSASYQATYTPSAYTRHGINLISPCACPHSVYEKWCRPRPRITQTIPPCCILSCLSLSLSRRVYPHPVYHASYHSRRKRREAIVAFGLTHGSNAYTNPPILCKLEKSA
jgi:hypothetical protein